MKYPKPTPKRERIYEHRSLVSLAEALADFADATNPGPCRELMHEAAHRLLDAADTLAVMDEQSRRPTLGDAMADPSWRAEIP